MAKIDNLYPCEPCNITPTQHEKDEWSRMAQWAYRTGRNSIGHTYGVAASLPREGRMTASYFDMLQTGYREWLLSADALAWRLGGE